VPDDLDGTWYQVIGAMSGKLLLFLCTLWRVRRPAIVITLTCGGFYESPTCPFVGSFGSASVPSAAGSQPLSRQSFGTFECNAGLQVGRKTLKDCARLAMTESSHHGRAEFECASHWRLKGPDVVPCLGGARRC
jgi:hypothetical protein